LSGVSLLFCLLAGRRSTADCLSLEKREGTLGLLFLTDLKGYDVVLGKLAATSIAGFYALMGILPVLAIPLLAGGMTRGEFWRMALVLANAFFLSLAIGIFASAVGGLGLLAAPASRFVPWLFYSCPVFSFVSAGDFARPALARDFWWSLGVTHGLAWMLTLLACWIVPRTWGDKPPPAPSRRWRWRELGRMANFGSPAKCAAFRKEALEANAFYWLAGRARLKPAHVWIFTGLGVIWWVYEWLKNGAYMMASGTCIFAALVVNSALKLWIAMEAGQRLGEDRRSGAFELLLATPLRVDDFLRGQILALRRQFFKPQPAVPGHDWIDLGTGQHHASAVKRDGTLRSWSEPLVANGGKVTLFGGVVPGQRARFNGGAPPRPREPFSNWVSVYCGSNSTFALQKDGTIWAWGEVSGFRGGRWINTSYPFPTVVCVETNWTALDASGVARNQSGELWDVANALPNPQAGAATVCFLVSSNGASDRVCSVSFGTRMQIRANGTLWVARLHPASSPAPVADDWRQLGTRSDWVAVWGQEETGFGMTSDGTVRTWGKELDKEPVKTYESRLDLLRERLTGGATPAASKVSVKYSAQPRPLLKLIGAKEDRRRK
jgi:hypothetical protein